MKLNLRDFLMRLATDDTAYASFLADRTVFSQSCLNPVDADLICAADLTALYTKLRQQAATAPDTPPSGAAPPDLPEHHASALAERWAESVIPGITTNES